MEISANHPFFTTANAMVEFVAPLKKYHINYFCYARKGMNGSRVYLETRPDSLQRYFSEKLYLEGNTEAKPVLYHNQAALWSTLPNQKIFQFARSIRIDHGVYLIQTHGDYCEFFSFASTPDHPEVINFYLNNLDVLQNFVANFKERGKKLIEEAKQHEILLPYHSRGFENYKADPMLANRPVKLTRKQMDCIQLLLKGSTAKQIAGALNISERTAEDHIQTLKNKYHAHNKTDLIVKLTRHFDSVLKLEISN